MEHECRDRRSSPRVSADNRTMMALHVSMPVQLLQLSSEGLLLACEASMRVGSTVRVVSELAGRRLDVELCVDEVSNRPDEEVGGYVLGGRFPSYDPTARQSITALLSANGIRPGSAAPRRRLRRGASLHKRAAEQTAWTADGIGW